MKKKYVAPEVGSRWRAANEVVLDDQSHKIEMGSTIKVVRVAKRRTYILVLTGSVKGSQVEITKRNWGSFEPIS